MGQEESRLVDEDTPSRTLERRDIGSVARYIKSGRVKRIVVMAGAGISTAAGIPDFRSPDTGLYANLAKLDLPYPEAVFDISYFRQNPLPFYALAHELFPGKFYPTVTHSFLYLLHRKGLLLKLFTQNIDCLERDAGVPEEKIVEAHGSFARHGCIDCQASYPSDQMEKAIMERRVPRCERPECGGLVKPDIVFFGQQLPENFHLNRTLPTAADLCIVIGTSLSVQPFASLPGFCGEEVPRVLINSERVGGLGSRPDDVLVLGDCDAGVRKLATALGWLDELEATWAKTQPKKKEEEETTEAVPRSQDQMLEDEIARLTVEVDTALKVSEDHDKFVRERIGHIVESKTDDETAEHAVSSDKSTSPANNKKKGL